MSSRIYGKLPIANWRDTEWVSLTVDGQWLYHYLVSQPTTDGAGVFPIQTRKWSKGAVGMTVERVNVAAKLLVERHRIVVDHDTEEGLLRTFIRDDNAGANIFKGQLGCAVQVQSPMLRAVLLSEIVLLERTFTTKEQELIDQLEASIPVGLLTPTLPSTTTATGAFEPPPDSVPTPSERRLNAVAQVCAKCEKRPVDGTFGMWCATCEAEAS
jgi:hypothetical protein